MADANTRSMSVPPEGVDGEPSSSPVIRLRQRPWLLASLSVLPLLVWWLGWYPGFASPDTIDQLTQVATGTYFDHHPPIHTLYLELLSQGGARTGVVTLFQAVALAALLAYGAKWLIAAGVPAWAAVAVCWLLALSPAVAPTTLALWKDVPFAFFVLWGWVELLALAVDPSRVERVWPALRLGLALAGIWLFRGNGPITVVVVVLVVAWVYRHRLGFLGRAVGTVAIAVLLVSGVLYDVLGVVSSGVHPAEVFLPDVAASYSSEPETFTEQDLALLAEVAPLSVWNDGYDCYDGTALLFHPEFDQVAVREAPGDYVALEASVLTRDPDSVLAHRACAANFLFAPAQPADAYLHRPPYDIPDNELGLRREPLAEWAFTVTDRIWRWAEVESRLWLTWRPALLVLPALAVLAVAAVRARPLLLPGSLFLAHLVNVAATSPSQEFRYAFPLYLVAALTIPLAVPSLRSRTST